MRVRIAATGAGRDIIFVDLLGNRQLQAVTSAMRQVLVKHRDELWPSTVQRSNAAPRTRSNIVPDLVPRSVLVPLDRLGAAQGFSGALAFIAYFMDDGEKYLPSKPIVIKIGVRTKLEDELRKAHAWPRHFLGEDTRFAHPFFLSGGASSRSLAVLIAPFSSEGALNSRQTGWRLKLNDLWKLLHEEVERTPTVLKNIVKLYELLHGIHRDGQVKCGRKMFSYADEYGRYLRGMHTTSAIPAGLFGSDQYTAAFGQEWPNPVRTVSRILALPPFEGACGPVHGDLHPKNVVIDRTLQPNVIDFGWAEREGHIVRDYVLMEINLRALTLPSQVSFPGLLDFCNALTPDDVISGGEPVIQSRMRIIREGLWHGISDHEIVQSWSNEYLIPMFLVAFGLVKHLDDARNQSALLLNILSLAKRVEEALDGEGQRS